VVAIQSRLIVMLVLFAALSLVFAVSASADVHGAYASPFTGYPGECLFAGTNILTSSSPDKHNVAGSNSCATNQNVAANLGHFDSAGRLIDSCDFYFNNWGTNYFQCPLQRSNLSGDYWSWGAAFVDNQGNTQWSFGCVNDASHYNKCFDGS